MRCSKFVHAVMAFMTVILLVPHAFAGDCIPFQVSCEKVDSMYIDLASDLRSDFGKEEKKLVVACVVSFTPEVHQKMIHLMRTLWRVSVSDYGWFHAFDTLEFGSSIE
ncbi:hypothetical protein [uncultured Pseudodesulfovibrio sp.]|uniref:hypothetical protein n=1 Tax=uncultured Pseudodesulfovibrio sp. TaxID=2035858 RepID=UPI0029C737DF|nr:hypothetical protein [uncultured Pseudodesulfovibrio sp.]